jgi:hypothetical protein
VSERERWPQSRTSPDTAGAHWITLFRKCSTLLYCAIAAEGTYDEIRDEGVLGLARAVADHHAPARGVRELASAHGLRDGADLVHLQEEGAAGLLLDGGLRERRSACD